jgi:Protein of unknown function (DUF3800)
MRSYADESKRPGSPLLSLAGYVMTESQFNALSHHWRASLGRLAYFHMKEGHHTEYPEVYRSLLDCIRPEHMTAGFHVAVNEDSYNKLSSTRLQGQSLRYWFGGPYTFCLNAYMLLIGEWLAKNRPEEETVAYFFDRGHARCGEANMFLGMVASDSRFRHTKLRYRMASHTFLDGKTEIGHVLQSADILAWHFNYYLVKGNMLPEGRKITRAVTCFYQHYLDEETISPHIRNTIDMERELMEKRASGRRSLPKDTRSFERSD